MYLAIPHKFFNPAAIPMFICRINSTIHLEQGQIYVTSQHNKKFGFVVVDFFKLPYKIVGTIKIARYTYFTQKYVFFLHKQNSSCLNTKLCAQLILDYVKANIHVHYVAFGGTCMNSQVSFEWKWAPHTCNCMPLQKSLRKYAYRYWLVNKSYMSIEQQKHRKIVIVMLFVISSGCFRKKGRNYFLLVSTESQ